MMKKYYLALDLKNDPALISQYLDFHRNVWPEVEAGLAAAGIEKMEIHRFHNRLFMTMEAADGFSFADKSRLDRKDPVVQKWESLMDKFQQRIPGTPGGEKWVMMDTIYTFPGTMPPPKNFSPAAVNGL